MDKAQQAVDSAAEGVKKIVTSEKKLKAKKEKGGDGGAASNTVSGNNFELYDNGTDI